MLEFGTRFVGTKTSTVSEMAWKPPENTSDLDRIDKLLKHYERVNLDQIQQIEHLNQTHDANAKRILDLERTKTTLMKNVKSLEGRIKFDKIAADGIKKKFNLLELEVRELKHANEQFGIERSEDKVRIAQLEEDLNNNRSDKLKFMHENSNLKKQNAELMAEEKNASGDALVARKDTLQKLEMVDHLLALNETFKRTIAAQSEEVLSLSHEQHDLNERLLHSKKQVVTLEGMTAEYNKTIDILQHEISRLRKELMNVANAVSDKSSAVLSRSGTKNKSNSVSTTIINSSYHGEEDGPYSLSRRPYSQVTVSRDRNRLSSASMSSSTKQDAGLLLLPSLSEAAAGCVASLSNSSGNLRRQQHHASGENKYKYVDLTEHLHGHGTHELTQQGSMVLVEGGAISSGPGQSVTSTVRSHILHGYEEALAPVPGAVAGKSSSMSCIYSNISNSGEYVCSPVSTPFRKTAASTSAASTALAAATQPKSQSQSQPAAYKLTDSVAELKKCYGTSMQGSSGHRKFKQNQQVEDRSHSLGSQQEQQRQDDGSHSPSVLLLSGSSNSSAVRFANHHHDHHHHHHHQQQQTTQSPVQLATLKHTGGGVAGAATAATCSASSVADASSKKSLFVGAGLGLKHNEALDAELRNLNKGSTQQLLKKILGDRFD